MSITRAPRPQSNFYLLDKQISEDQRLSWAGRGLLVFLLGKPDHWQVSVEHLVKETKGAIGKSTGRDAVYGLLDELRQAGYLRRVGQARGEGGKMGGAQYVVHEVPSLPDEAQLATEEPAQPAVSPCPEKPYTAEPSTGEPHTGYPSTAKPTLVSTDQKQGLNGKQGLRRAAPRKTPKPSFSLPEWIDAEAWKSYESMRQKIRKPMTDDAKVLAVKTLDTLRALGQDPRAVLEQSVFNSWQGLFAIKPDRGGLLPARAAPVASGHADETTLAAMRKYGIGGGDVIDMED